MKKFLGKTLLLAAAFALGANCFAVSACDAAVGPHEHIYGGWEVLSLATCTENGLRAHTCAICKQKEEEEIPAEILDLVQKRREARKNKDFALADSIRDEITAKGYIVEETRQGTNIRKA